LGDHGETAAVGAGPGGLDAGVEGEDPGPFGDVGDGPDDAVDLLHLLPEAPEPAFQLADTREVGLEGLEGLAEPSGPCPYLYGRLLDPGRCRLGVPGGGGEPLGRLLHLLLHLSQVTAHA